MSEVDTFRENVDLLNIDNYPYIMMDDPEIDVTKEIIINEDNCKSFLGMLYSERRRTIYRKLKLIQHNNMVLDKWNHSAYFLIARLYSDRVFFDLPKKLDNFLVRVKFSIVDFSYMVVYHSHTTSDKDHLLALSFLMKYGVMLPDLMSDYYTPQRKIR